MTSNTFGVLSKHSGVQYGILNIVIALQNIFEIGHVQCHILAKETNFTGGTRAGKLLLKQSSATVKNLRLELGSDTALVISEGIDPEKAVSTLLLRGSAFLIRDSCTRTISCVQREIYEDCVMRLIDDVNLLNLTPGFDDWITHSPIYQSLYEMQKSKE